MHVVLSANLDGTSVPNIGFIVAMLQGRVSKMIKEVRIERTKIEVQVSVVAHEAGEDAEKEIAKMQAALTGLVAEFDGTAEMEAMSIAVRDILKGELSKRM